MKKQLKEIARIQHEEIMRPFLNNLISKCLRPGLNLIIPELYEDRLIRIANTSFDDLTPEEQEGDIVQIEKMLEILNIEKAKSNNTILSRTIQFTEDVKSQIVYSCDNVTLLTCIHPSCYPVKFEKVVINKVMYEVSDIINEVETDTIFCYLQRPYERNKI